MRDAMRRAKLVAIQLGLVLVAACNTPPTGQSHYAVTVEIHIEAQDVGKLGNLVVPVLRQTADDRTYYFVDDSGRLQRWDMDPASLGPVRPANNFRAREILDLVLVDLDRGEYRLYLAYQPLHERQLIYTGKAVAFHID